MEFPRKTVNPSQKNWVKHISFGLHHIFACVANWGFVRNFCRVRNFDHFRNSDPSFSKLVDPGGFQKFTYIVGEILKNAYFGGFKNFEKLGFEFPARSKFRSRQKFRTKSHFSTHTKIWCKPTKICFIQFFGKDWHFFEGTPFFRGGRQIFDFFKAKFKVLKSSIFECFSRLGNFCRSRNFYIAGYTKASLFAKSVLHSKYRLSYAENLNQKLGLWRKQKSARFFRKKTMSLEDVKSLVPKRTGPFTSIFLALLEAITSIDR